MEARQTPYPWIKLFAPKLIRGTMAGEPPIHVGIFVKLLCLANESGYRDGRLLIPPDKPMSREYIASNLNIPLDDLNEAIKAFKGEINQDPTSEHYGAARMQELDGGMLFITNFVDYQAKPDGKGKRSETPRERELRERKDLHRKSEKYPDETDIIVTERLHTKARQQEQRDLNKGGKT